MARSLYLRFFTLLLSFSLLFVTNITNTSAQTEVPTLHPPDETPVHRVLDTPVPLGTPYCPLMDKPLLWGVKTPSARWISECGRCWLYPTSTSIVPSLPSSTPDLNNPYLYEVDYGEHICSGGWSSCFSLDITSDYLIAVKVIHVTDGEGDNNVGIYLESERHYSNAVYGPESLSVISYGMNSWGSYVESLINQRYNQFVYYSSSFIAGYYEWLSVDPYRKLDVISGSNGAVKRVVALYVGFGQPPTPTPSPSSTPLPYRCGTTFSVEGEQGQGAYNVIPDEESPFLIDLNTQDPYYSVHFSSDALGEQEWIMAVSTGSGEFDPVFDKTPVSEEMVSDEVVRYKFSSPIGVVGMQGESGVFKRAQFKLLCKESQVQYAQNNYCAVVDDGRGLTGSPGVELPGIIVGDKQCWHITDAKQLTVGSADVSIPSIDLCVAPIEFGFIYLFGIRINMDVLAVGLFVIWGARTMIKAV